MSIPKVPSNAAIKAASTTLDEDGRFYGWWPKEAPTYPNLDSIGKNEFEAIVERILIAAYAAEE